MCELPAHPVSAKRDWKHLEGLRLADPEYNKSGRIDVLLGVEVFLEVMCQGRRHGPSNSPTAINTEFGWVLAGNMGHPSDTPVVTTHFSSVLSGGRPTLTLLGIGRKDNSKLHTHPGRTCCPQSSHHTRDAQGRFIVPLPKRSLETDLGESRSQAVRRFLSFERSLHAKGSFPEVRKVIDEYLVDDHAEEVPIADLEKPVQEVFYLLIHVVHKESSTTTKVRVVFDASASTSSGISLNDTLMAGPNVHRPLVHVLIRFRTHRTALIQPNVPSDTVDTVR